MNGYFWFLHYPLLQLFPKASTNHSGFTCQSHMWQAQSFSMWHNCRYLYRILVCPQMLLFSTWTVLCVHGMVWRFPGGNGHSSSECTLLATFRVEVGRAEAAAPDFLESHQEVRLPGLSSAPRFSTTLLHPIASEVPSSESSSDPFPHIGTVCLFTFMSSARHPLPPY
jgi:hypothetical protein